MSDDMLDDMDIHDYVSVKVMADLQVKEVSAFFKKLSTETPLYILV